MILFRNVSNVFLFLILLFLLSMLPQTSGPTMGEMIANINEGNDEQNTRDT